MFTIKLQQQDRRGNYSTVKSLNVSQFSDAVAKKAMEIASLHNLRVSMYVRDEPVPAGWSSRELEYSTQIWLTLELSEADALAELSELPF